MVSWWSFLRFSARAMCQSSPTWPLTTCPMTIWWNTFSKKTFKKWFQSLIEAVLRQSVATSAPAYHFNSGPAVLSGLWFVNNKKLYIFLFFHLEKNKVLVFFFGLNKALTPSQYRANVFYRESMATSEFILHVDRLRGRYTTTTAPIQFKRKKLILWDLHISDFQ